MSEEFPTLYLVVTISCVCDPRHNSCPTPLLAVPIALEINLKKVIIDSNDVSEEDLTALFPHPTGPINLTGVKDQKGAWARRVILWTDSRDKDITLRLGD